jgi:hypothetical protein
MFHTYKFELDWDAIANSLAQMSIDQQINAERTYGKHGYTHDRALFVSTMGMARFGGGRQIGATQAAIKHAKAQGYIFVTQRRTFPKDAPNLRCVAIEDLMSEQSQGCTFFKGEYPVGLVFDGSSLFDYSNRQIQYAAKVALNHAANKHPSPIPFIVLG